MPLTFPKPKLAFTFDSYFSWPHSGIRLWPLPLVWRFDFYSVSPRVSAGWLTVLSWSHRSFFPPDPPSISGLLFKFPSLLISGWPHPYLWFFWSFHTGILKIILLSKNSFWGFSLERLTAPHISVLGWSKDISHFDLYLWHWLLSTLNLLLCVTWFSERTVYSNNEKNRISSVSRSYLCVLLYHIIEPD